MTRGKDLYRRRRRLARRGPEPVAFSRDQGDRTGRSWEVRDAAGRDVSGLYHMSLVAKLLRGATTGRPFFCERFRWDRGGHVFLEHPPRRRPRGHRPRLLASRLAYLLVREVRRRQASRGLDRGAGRRVASAPEAEQ